MQRRQVLKLSVSALVPALVAGCSKADERSAAATATAPSGTTGAVERLDKFGLQLSTVTALMVADFEGTLRAVADVGYQQVEFSAMGFLGRSVKQVQALLQETGLEAPVGRVTPRLPADVMQMPPEQARAVFAERGGAEHLVDNVELALEHTLTMGQRILNVPALMPRDFQSLDQVKRNIEYMNRAGELCAAQGVLFGYHNHDWEFAPLDGVIPFDVMLDETDADKVSFQLDAYWVAKAGRESSDYLERYSGRFNSCHLKDIDANGDFADVGHGTLDFPRFVRESIEAGANYFFVERDNPPEPAESIRRSYAYLRDMTY